MGSALAQKEIRSLLKHLEAEGATVLPGKRGAKVRFENGATTSIHLTNSDHRSTLNMRAIIKRNGHTWPWDSENQKMSTATVEEIDFKYPRVVFNNERPNDHTLGDVRGVIKYLADRGEHQFITARISNFLRAAGPDHITTHTYVARVLYWLGYRADPTTVKPYARGWSFEWVLDPALDRSNKGETLPITYFTDPKIEEQAADLEAAAVDMREHGDDEALQELITEARRGVGLVDDTAIERYDEASDSLTEDEQSGLRDLMSTPTVFDEQVSDSKDIDWALGEIERLEGLYGIAKEDALQYRGEVEQLEGEVSRLSGAYDFVEAARVALVEERDNLYAERDQLRQQIEDQYHHILKLTEQANASAPEDGWEIKPDQVAGMQVATMIEESAAFGVRIRIIASRA